MKIIRLCIAVLISLNGVQTALANKLFIGIIEHASKSRALFVKKSERWETLGKTENLKKYNLSKIRWTIAFDGKNIGNIITTDPNPENKSIDNGNIRNKILIIKNPQNVPKIINKSKRFSGWSIAPEYRPLVIVSQENYKDEQKWKPFKPDQSYSKLLFPHVNNLINNQGDCYPNCYNIKFKLTPNKLQAFRGYRNSKNEEIVSVGIALSHLKYGHAELGHLLPLETPQWFFITKTHKSITYIGNQLDLIDAGDYDADGEIEFIFWHFGYNEGGYSLFDKEFKERVDYFFGYH